MKRRGTPAAAWFYGQSFHSAPAAPCDRHGHQFEQCEANQRQCRHCPIIENRCATCGEWIRGAYEHTQPCPLPWALGD